jgi:glutaredoxin 3
MTRLFEDQWAEFKRALLEGHDLANGVPSNRKTMSILLTGCQRRNYMRATIYTKDNCPYCVMAKNLLASKNITITEVSAVENREKLIESVTAVTGRAPRTVPQIWLGDQYIGGHDDLVEHFKNQA